MQQAPVYQNETLLPSKRHFLRQPKLSLVKKRGFAAIDECCRIALEVDVANYRIVARLANRPSGEQDVLRQTHDLIRQLHHYRDVIRRKTETEPETHEPDRTRSRTEEATPFRHG